MVFFNAFGGKLFFQYWPGCLKTEIPYHQKPLNAGLGIQTGQCTDFANCLAGCNNGPRMNMFFEFSTVVFCFRVRTLYQKQHSNSMYYKLVQVKITIYSTFKSCFCFASSTYFYHLPFFPISCFNTFHPFFLFHVSIGFIHFAYFMFHQISSFFSISSRKIEREKPRK